MMKFKINFFVLVFVLATTVLPAANRFWVHNGLGTGNWNNTSNWSTTSGGSGGASVPGSGDIAIFNSGGLSACSINAAANVAGISILANVTITQSSVKVIVGASGFDQQAGTFNESSTDSLIINGTFSKSSGGSFNAAGKLCFRGNVSIDGGFNAGTSQANINGTRSVAAAGISFYDFFFVPNASTGCTIAVSDFTVTDTLKYAGTTNPITVNGVGQTINVTGHVSITNTVTGGGGSATINISGSSSRSLIGNGTSLGGALGNVTIDKTSGTLTLSNTTSIAGDLTYTSGTISAGSSTIVLTNNASNSITVAGTFTVANLSFSPSASFTVAVSNTVTVSSTATFAGGSNSLTINTGTIASTGSVTVSNTGTGSGGSATLLINGTGSQTITGNGGITNGFLPNVIINKSAGTATLGATTGIGGALTLTAGTLSASSFGIGLKGDWTNNGATFTAGTGTVTFMGSGTQTVGGSTTSHSMYNVTINPSANYTLAITSGHTVTSSNTLTVSGGSNNISINTGTLASTGTVTVSNTGSASGGSGTLLINGSGAQSINGNGTTNSGFLPHMEVNKSAGTASVGATVGVGNLTLTGGTLQLSVGNIAVKGNLTHNSATFSGGLSNRIFFVGSGKQTISGSTTTLSVTNMTIEPVATDTIEISSGHTIAVGRDVTFAGGSANLLINTGTITIGRNFTITNTGTGSGGTGTIIISGTGSQNITGNGGITNGFLPNVEINKSAGTSTVAGSVGIAGNLTLTAGTLDNSSNTIGLKGNWTNNGATFTPSTGTVSFVGSGTQTVGGSTTSHSMYNLTINPTATYTFAITSGHTITSSNLFTLAGSSNSVSINTGTIACTGSVTVTNSSASSGGSSIILINGTGAQTITGNGSVFNGFLPNLEINKSSGTATLANTLGVRGNVTLTAGTLDASSFSIALKGDWANNGATFTPGTGTVLFTGAGSQTIGGSTTTHPMYNCTIGPTSSLVFTITGGHTVTVSNLLSIAGAGNSVSIATGTIACTGSVTVSNSSSATGGSGTILINGTGAQTITGNGGITTGFLPNLTINKSAGTATLGASVGIAGNLLLTAGTLNASTFTIGVKGDWTNNGATFTPSTSTVSFIGSGTQTVGGSTTSHSMYNLTINPTATYTFAITSGHTITSSNLVTISGGSNSIQINTGTIASTGSVTVSNTGGLSGGTGTLLINGTGAQTITGHNNLTNGYVCNVEINKSSGTATLADNFGVGGNLVLTQGTLDASTYKIGVKGNWTNNGATFTYGTGSVGFVGSGAQAINGSAATQSFYTLVCSKTSDTLKVSGSTTTVNVNDSLNVDMGYFIGPGTLNVTKGIYVESGAGFTLGGSTNLGGYWTNNGTIVPGTGTVTFNGTTANQYLYADDGTENFYNLVINKPSFTLNLSSAIACSNNLTITAGTLVTNNNNITLNGNWTNVGATFTPGTSTVTFTGNNHVQVSKTSSTETFSNIVVNKSGGSITLGSPVAITTTAAFTKGIIKSTSSNFLEFKDNATYSGGSDSSFVDGPVKKTGDDTFTFPLGDTTFTFGQFHPVKLTAPSVSTDAYMATYYDTIQTQGSGLSGCIDFLNSCEHWLIKRTAGSSNVKATIYWNNLLCFTTDTQLNTIARWNSSGPEWESLGVDDYYYTFTTCSLKTAINLPFDGSGNCYLAQAKNRLQSTEMSVDIGNDTILCNLATLNLSSSMTGGSVPFTYAWSPSDSLSDTTISNPVANPSASITYVLHVMDDRNCSALDTINITVSTPITVDVTGDRNVCGGSESMLTAHADGGYAPYIYAWTPATALNDDSIPDPIASPSSNTTYTLTITDTIGCVITDTVQMHAVSSFTLTAMSDFDVCPGVLFSLSASGADHYSWFPTDDMNHFDVSDPDVNGILDTTKYYVTGWIGDCQVVDSVLVRTKIPPALSLPSDTLVSCSGASVSITASGSGTYVWVDTEGDTVSTSSGLSVSPTLTTVYNVSLTGANGCISSTSVSVLIDSIRIIMSDSILLLEGEQKTLSVLSDGNTFDWTPAIGLDDTTILNPLCDVGTTTTYTFTAYKNGCQRSETVKVWQVKKPLIYFTYTYPNLAVDFTIPNTITGTTYAWDFGDGGTSSTQNPTHTFSSAGSYRVIVTVQNAFGTTKYSDLVIVRN